MHRFKLLISFALLIAFSVACRQIYTEPKKTVCPPFKQSCYPYKWKGLSVDTSFEYRRISDLYYIFDNLKSVNSPEDEWALSFVDDKKAILTFSDNDQQRIMMLKLTAFNRGSVESGIGIPLEGSIGSVSVNHKKVLISSSPSNNDSTNVLGNCDIFSADLQGNIIVKISKLNNELYNDKLTWESHPAFSANGKVIFFASDRAPGIGTDIWFMIKMKDGSWSKPILCSDSVNSRCDEITPFVTKDSKTLLFSSCGHETVGGYDIFSSNINPDFWKLAEDGNIEQLEKRKDLFSYAANLRPPLNTSSDELFPSTPGNFNELLYYSSNQKQGFESIVMLTGGFDIYVRKLEKNIRIADNTRKTVGGDVELNIDVAENKLGTAEIKIAPRYYLAGKVFNETTKQLLPNAEIIIRKISQDRNLNENVPNTNELELTTLGSDLFYDTFTDKADSAGDYKISLEKGKDYEITAQTAKMFYESFKIRVEKDDTVKLIQKDFYVPEVLTLRINFPTDKYKTPYKYSLDSNGVETNMLWEEAIENLARNLIMSKEKVSKLILIGHTDDVGSVAYNYELGLNRVNFIISQLVARGVPQEMLEGRSAGELEPLKMLPDETLQMYRKRLRRVELQKVMKS